MQPKNSPVNQKDERSFIEQTRRKQIIEATIYVLAEHGYIHASFVKIAKKADINPSLISYHFQDKAELTNEVRTTIYAQRYEHVEKATNDAQDQTAKLEAYIRSDMEYMSGHPELFRALVEVLFGQRDEAGMPKYMSDTDAPMLLLLHKILQSGQISGEFGEFNTYALAHVVDGAKDQFLAQLPFRPNLNVKEFSRTLLEMVMKVVKS